MHKYEDEHYRIGFDYHTTKKLVSLSLVQASENGKYINLIARTRLWLQLSQYMINQQFYDSITGTTVVKLFFAGSLHDLSAFMLES